MDFTSHGSQAAPVRAAAAGGGTPSASGGSRKNMSWKGSPSWLRIVTVVLLFSATIVVVSLLALLYFGGPKEANYVDTSKQQAVFLTNGQVYFGKVAAVNKQYIELQKIYYLNVNQQVQPDQKDSKNAAQSGQSNSISLVKLGCELHGPLDQMIINREQVTFWENLKTDGQVAKAIDQWVKQNPGGQQCTQASGDTTQNTTKP